MYVGYMMDPVQVNFIGQLKFAMKLLVAGRIKWVKQSKFVTSHINFLATPTAEIIPCIGSL